MTERATAIKNPAAQRLSLTSKEAEDAAARKVIEQLQARAQENASVPNQRRAERHPWVTSLTVMLEETPGKWRTVEVTSHDISTGGFSFVYRQFTHVGTNVRVNINCLPGRPILDGAVRSCVYIGGHHHRIGVQFQVAEQPSPEA